jgi:hypothetical protein
MTCRALSTCRPSPKAQVHHKHMSPVGGVKSDRLRGATVAFG